ncbi:hypothetical protein IE53DRAFT_389628 [Violaceomyces palustris]|uniref:Uncharacterized protein n=1 Tax=Violaceomyces palustris TaxID=1673888 RepID=A0ACD0NQX5_9BASI|nr:hypothetical protein IE53DRAFT_389628 [Violaceomyces palustris]
MDGWKGGWMVGSSLLSLPLPPPPHPPCATDTPQTQSALPQEPSKETRREIHPVVERQKAKGGTGERPIEFCSGRAARFAFQRM